VPNGGVRKAGYMLDLLGARWVVNEGTYSSDPQGPRGGLQNLMEHCSSCEISVGMYKVKEATEKFCSDLLSYPVFMLKLSTHRMHDLGSNVPHIRQKVLTDNQMS
jgi:hypothetical protein